MKIAKELDKLIPYQAGKPIEETKREFQLKEVYKLASNENALGMSPKARQAIEAAVKDLFRYPDPAAFDLTQKFSKLLGVNPDELLFCNGSDEGIDLLIRVFCNPGDKILTSQYAFAAYGVRAGASRIEITNVPATSDFKIDLSAFKKHWTEKHKLIFLPNPNNPTGSYFNKAEFEDFLNDFGNRDDVMIILDEAYIEFVRAKDYPNGIEYYKKFSNIMLCRTLSKVYGLAGLRIGYLVGKPKYLNYLHRVRTPFNINYLAQVGALAAIDDLEYVKASQELVWMGLDYFAEEFKKLNIKAYPSEANFMLFDCAGPAAPLAQGLLKKGLILRPLMPYSLPNHLRISVGLKAENEIAMKWIGEIFSKR
ncbi:MAG: histidinol-phosphate transaminase [Bdellovibrionales bacterium]|nr:histidinol-phosphate transaminase [Bdellovibrionales bacterium]